MHRQNKKQKQRKQKHRRITGQIKESQDQKKKLTKPKNKSRMQTEG